MTHVMSNQLSCNIESHPSKLDFALQIQAWGMDFFEKSYAMLLINLGCLYL